MDTIEVEPVEGQTAVYEHGPKRRITTRCKVPSTTFYRRMIAKGGLREVKPGEKKTETARASRTEKEG